MKNHAKPLRPRDGANIPTITEKKSQVTTISMMAGIHALVAANYDPGSLSFTDRDAFV